MRNERVIAMVGFLLGRSVSSVVNFQACAVNVGVNFELKTRKIFLISASE